jgi:hypothetical protein
MASNGEKRDEQNRELAELLAQTRAAVADLKDLQRKGGKVQSLADTGEQDQAGFLTKRQVLLFKRLTREMEDIYRSHQQKLQRMEQDHQRKIKETYGTDLDGLRREVEKRQSLYNNAEGGNRWGDVASDAVRQHHKDRLTQAQTNLADATKSDSSMDDLRDAIQRLESSFNSYQPHVGRVNDLRQAHPQYSAMANNIMGSLSQIGMITGVGAYLHYANPELLRGQERGSYHVSQRLTEMNGIANYDSEYREKAESAGEKYNYGVNESMQLQRLLMAGGLSTAENMNKDMGIAQQFSRAYATDPSGIAQTSVLLKQMGAMADGDMQRLASLIGGQVSQTNMRGREEEVNRSLVTLLGQVSRGLPFMREDGINNLSSMQTALGQAIPELRGDRGAQVLSNWDSAIKDGDHQMELLLGKGTELTTLEDMVELERRKELGISDPENARRIFKGMQTFMGGDSSNPMWKLAYKQQNMGTVSEYEALQESGFIDRIIRGDMPSADELRGAGLEDLAKEWEQYSGSSETGQVDRNEALAQNRRADHQKYTDEIGKWFSDIFNSIPEPLQHMLLGGAGASAVMGAPFLFKGARNLLRKATSTKIGGGGTPGGGIAGSLKGMGSKAGNLFKKVLGPAGTVGTLALAEDAGGGLADFIFGHKEGTKKPGYDLGDLLQLKNPFSDEYKEEQIWKDTKEPIWKRYNWFGGDEEASAKKDDAKYSLVGDLDSVKSEHTVKVVVDGKIEGMGKGNEEEVKNSIKDYFASLVGYEGSGVFNLSRDQRRS